MGNRRKERNKVAKNIGFWLLFLLYLLVLSYFLFFSEYYGRTQVQETYRYNLVLFSEIRRFLANRQATGLYVVLVNLCGNVLVFVPMGLFLPHLSHHRLGIVMVTLIGAAASSVFEFIQFLCKIGVFDVDDIFLNTCGTFLGYLVYFCIWHTRKRKMLLSR